MSTKIYKYQLEFDDKGIATVNMPRHSEFLTIKIQNDIPVLWAIVDTSYEPVPKTIRVYGTGWDFEGGCYIATVEHGPFVWHYFEL